MRSDIPLVVEFSEIATVLGTSDYGEHDGLDC